MRRLLSLLLTFTLLLAQVPAFGFYVPVKKWGHNYFGSAIDGTKTVTANPENITNSGSTTLVLQYDDLTVNSSAWFQIYSSTGCVIYVKDDCVINGALTVSTNAAKASPTEGIHHRQFVDATNVKGLSTTYHTPATGGAGGTGGNAGGAENGDAGGTVTNGTGGGGGGAGGAGTGFNFGNGGAGSAGTCWGGGSGGGGGGYNYASNTPITGGAAGANHGAGGGGNVIQGSPSGAASGGGAGNPGGTGDAAGSASGNNGLETTGGHLWLIVGDDLTIGASGVINTPGQAGGNASGASGNGAQGGGASGGGVTEVYYGGTLSNSGTVTAGGGVGGDGSGSVSSFDGGAGGAGTVRGPTKIAQRNQSPPFMIPFLLLGRPKRRRQHFEDRAA